MLAVVFFLPRACDPSGDWFLPTVFASRLIVDLAFGWDDAPFLFLSIFVRVLRFSLALCPDSGLEIEILLVILHDWSLYGRVGEFRVLG